MTYELLPILLATLKILANPSSCPSAEAEHPLKVLNAKHVGAAGMVLRRNNTHSRSNVPCPAGLLTSLIPDAPPLWFLLLTSQISSLGRSGFKRESQGNDEELHAKFVVCCWQRALQTKEAEPNPQKGSTTHHGANSTWDTPRCLFHKLSLHCKLGVRGRQVSSPSQPCWSSSPTLLSEWLLSEWTSGP